MRYRCGSGVKIIFIAPVPDVNVCRKEYIPPAGWAVDDHGDVWMFRSCGVCELQASDEDHPVCRLHKLMFVQSTRFPTLTTFKRRRHGEEFEHVCQ